MEQRKLHNFDLTSFKKATQEMVASSEAAFMGEWAISRYKNEKIKTYSQEEVAKIIESGTISQKIELSQTFFMTDGFYRKLLVMMATLLNYYGILIPNPSFGQNLSTPHISKKYFSAVDYVDRMKLPTLFTNISLKVLTEGTYYGFIKIADKNSFVVMDLPQAYCRSLYKDPMGNDLIEFDVTYFNSIVDSKARDKALKAYPKFIAKAYRKFRNGKLDSKWVFIPADISLCFQFTTDGLPMFLNVIPAAIDYDSAVETEKERELDEIRKIIVQKIPHLNTGELLFEPDEALEMHKGTVGMMKGNKNVSVLTTYADTDAIASRTSSEAATNNLEKMLNNLYAEAGVSKELFASTSNLTLEYSIKTLINLMMVLGEKYGNFITSIINGIYGNSNITFKYKILPITRYTEQKYIDSAFKLATSGYSFLLPAIAMGFSQKDLGNIKDLENDVLNLGEKLIPLTSSYTQSSEGEGAGRPKKEPSEKSPKTEQNEKSLDNQGGSVNG